MVLCNDTDTQRKIQSVTELVTASVEKTDAPEKKMTYNEWRQLRKRRKCQNKAPEFQTRLQSLEVQAGYSVKLSVVVTASPAPRVYWTIDDEEIENDQVYTIEQDEAENKYSLTISHISVQQSGCYQCVAINQEGSNSCMGFVNVKDSSSERRRRSVSRRPLVSTIMEWRSKEEPSDPVKERLMLLNRHCWDWWSLGSSIDEDESEEKENRAKREQSCDLDMREPESKTEEEWEETRRQTQMTSVRSKSLPNMTENVVENRYAKLKSFWEKQRFLK